MKTINASNFGITASLTAMALTQSGLVWAISRAQHQALEHLTMCTPVVEIRKTLSEGLEHFSIYPTIKALAGIPSAIDESLPPGCIELRLDATALVRIENCAVPFGMAE